MTYRVERVEFEGGGRLFSKRKLVGVHHNARGEAVVACVHGIFENKDLDRYHQMAEFFPRYGLSVFRYDQAGMGESVRKRQKFEDQTMGMKVADLRAVIDHLTEEEGYNRIGVCAYSVGGYVAVRAELAEKGYGVDALVALGTPYSLREVFSHQNFQDDGDVWISEGGLRLKKGVVTEALEEDRGGVIHRAISKLPPFLIQHGGLDRVVPVADAHRYSSQQGGIRQLHVIEGGDHGLSNPDHRKEGIESALEFFDGYLLH